MLEFLNSCLDLWICFFDSSLLNFWFYPVICLSFLATFPAIVRAITTWR